MITGANRGIGLALVREYLRHPEVQLFAACCRPDAAHDLQALSADHPDRLVVLPLEVTDPEAVSAVAAAVAARTDGLDALINNAGINPPGQSLAEIDTETMLHVLHVNTVAPLMVTKVFLRLLEGGVSPRVVNVSSIMGSLSHTSGGGYYAYRTSKAALNMVTRIMAGDLRARGITVICLHPGWVRTDMGGGGAPLSPEESAQGIVRVISRLSPADSGHFLQWNGEELPW